MWTNHSVNIDPTVMKINANSTQEEVKVELVRPSLFALDIEDKDAEALAVTTVVMFNEWKKLSDNAYIMCSISKIRLMYS